MPPKSPVLKLQEPAQVVSVSYNVERQSTFEWQAHKITILTDGSHTSDPIFAPNTIEIVLGKIAKQMRSEGQADFIAAKIANA